MALGVGVWRWGFQLQENWKEEDQQHHLQICTPGNTNLINLNYFANW